MIGRLVRITRRRAVSFFVALAGALTLIIGLPLIAEADQLVGGQWCYYDASHKTGAQVIRQDGTGQVRISYAAYGTNVINSDGSGWGNSEAIDQIQVVSYDANTNTQDGPGEVDNPGGIYGYDWTTNTSLFTWQTSAHHQKVFFWMYRAASTNRTCSVWIYDY